MRSKAYQRGHRIGLVIGQGLALAVLASPVVIFLRWLLWGHL